MNRELAHCLPSFSQAPRQVRPAFFLPYVIPSYVSANTCESAHPLHPPQPGAAPLSQDVQEEEEDVGQGAPLQACVFFPSQRVISVTGSTVAKQAWALFI